MHKKLLRSESVTPFSPESSPNSQFKAKKVWHFHPNYGTGAIVGSLVIGHLAPPSFNCHSVVIWPAAVIHCHLLVTRSSNVQCPTSGRAVDHLTLDFGLWTNSSFVLLHSSFVLPLPPAHLPGRRPFSPSRRLYGVGDQAGGYLLPTTFQPLYFGPDYIT